MTQITEAPKDFDNSYFKMPDHVDHDSQYKIAQWIKIMLEGTASFYVPEYNVDKAEQIQSIVSDKGFNMLFKTVTPKTKFAEFFFEKIIA
jgi:hypothetical protein